MTSWPFKTIGFLSIIFSFNGAEGAAIVATRTSGVAPLLVVFHDSDASASDGIGTEPFHDYEYKWLFGDPSAGNWGTDGSDKNSAKGPIAAHIFESAGTYQVSLTVQTASDNMGTDTETITVSDPDTVYSGTATTCLNTINDNDFAGCPSGANHIQYDDLADGNVTSAAEDGERLLLKRGSFWSLLSTPSWPNSDGPVTIGAYGICTTPDLQGICSNAPQITMSGEVNFLNLDHNQDIRIMDLRIVGLGVNGVTDMQKVTLLRMNMEDAPPGTLGGTGCVTCTASLGWGHWNDSTPMTIQEMAIVDSHIEDSGDYALYVGGEYIALLGNVFNDSGSTHLVRVWQSYKGVIEHNVLSAAHTGCSSGECRHALKLHGPDDVHENTEHCSPGAGNNGCLANYTAFTIVSDNIFGGSGPWPVNIEPQSPYADSVLSDIIVERNLWMRDYGSTPYSNNSRMLHVAGNYYSIRNNIFDASNAGPDYRGIVINGINGGTAEDFQHLRSITCNRIQNNTFYRSDTPNDTNYGIEIRAGATENVIRNNLYSAENATATSAPLLDNGTNTTSTNNLDIDVPNFVDPDNVNPLSRNFELQSGSLAINQGITIEVLDDYADLRRVGLNYDVGAHEYGAPPTDMTSPQINNTAPAGSFTCE